MPPEKTRRVLSISTLWPNPAQPRFGTFVARSIEALQRETQWHATVINPIGLPPLAPGRYSAIKRAAVTGEENGVIVHRPTFRLIPAVGARFNPGAIARTILPLARKLHAEQPFDVVDAQFFWPDGPAAARIARALDLPLSIKARGADIHYWGQQDFSRTMMMDAADQASGLISVSKALANDMAELGMKGDKITVHYTGLDRDQFYPREQQDLRAQLGKQFGIALRDDAHLLATIGALIPRKGQRFVIGALAGIPDAQLLLVGQGPDETELRAFADEQGLGERVHFVGSLDHDIVPLVLSASDAMVLPSASEGLANAWIEALACGTPIVICEAGGARELMTRPEAGEIVERDANAVQAGIERVLAARYPAAEVAATVADFSWAENGRRLAAYYDSLIHA